MAFRMFEIFAVTAPGLEPIALAEVAALGLQGRAVPGGVELRGGLAEVQRLNLWLRTATRVLVRLGTVKATAFPELVRKASELPWAAFVRQGAQVQIRATCRKSRLYHSAGVAERLLTALQSKVKGVTEAPRSSTQAPPGEAEASPAGAKAPPGDAEQVTGQLIVARFDHDVCTVSVDSSGELLHMRGWRGPAAKAPLRETLAAALLLVAGYTGDEPLCDPLCGSGTIAIEGALLAQRRAPGLDARLRVRAVAAVFAQELGRAARAGSRARAAAARASRSVRSRCGRCGGYAGECRQGRRSGAGLAAAPPGSARGRGRCCRRECCGLGGAVARPAGLLACNPPYGVRIAAGAVWRDLGEALRRRPSWRVAAVIADERAAFDARVAWKQLARTENGGLRIALCLGAPGS